MRTQHSIVPYSQQHSACRLCENQKTRPALVLPRQCPSRKPFCVLSPVPTLITQPIPGASRTGLSEHEKLRGYEAISLLTRALQNNTDTASQVGASPLGRIFTRQSAPVRVRVQTKVLQQLCKPSYNLRGLRCPRSDANQSLAQEHERTGWRCTRVGRLKQAAAKFRYICFRPELPGRPCRNF